MTARVAHPSAMPAPACTTMPGMLIEQVTVGAPGLADAATLFDAYRIHYGSATAPDRAAAWLRTHLAADRLLVWVARDDPDTPVGIVIVAPSPASIALGMNWGIRDLYVTPRARRRGVAAALLRRVLDEAYAAGASRVALQTEIDNTPARALYQRLGFDVVDGYVALSWATRLSTAG